MDDDNSGGGGSNKWLLWVGAGAGVLGLIYLITRGSGSGTTAAGTSINAALGSLQNEQQNLLGTVQAGTQQLGSQVAGVSGQVSDVSSLETATQQQMAAGFAAQAQMTSDLIGQLSTSLNQNIAGLSQQQQALFSGLSQQEQNLYNNLIALVNAGEVSNQQAFDVLQQSAAQGLVTGNGILAALQVIQQQSASQAAALNNGLGGSLGTLKGEVLTLAYTLGKGTAAQNYLTSRGDFTQPGQSYNG